MRNARLLPAGRSIAVIASAVSVLFASVPLSAGAVETLAGSRSIQANETAISGETVALGGARRDGWKFRRREKCFMRRINRIRRSHGLNSLQFDKQLGVVGRKHARRLADAGSVWHDDIASKVTRWRSLGQNTGKGPGCRKLTRAFMHSAGHRANYLGRWRHVGVGVVTRHGAVYVQQVFESRRDPGNIWHKP